MSFRDDAWEVRFRSIEARFELVKTQLQGLNVVCQALCTATSVMTLNPVLGAEYKKMQGQLEEMKSLVDAM